MRFKNKVVLISGAGSGIGKETAHQFANEGAIVCLSDIDENSGKAVQKCIQHQGGQAHFMRVDVSQSADCYRWIHAVSKHYGRIDVLFNNAGIEISGPVIDFSEQDFDKLMAVNVKSVFLCSKYALNKMVVQRSGVIINAASVASFLAWRDDAVYSATKAAVLLLTKAMAIEYAPFSIRVNAIAPAIIDTPMTARALAQYADPSHAKKEKARLHPLGRLGTPREVADAVLFLSADTASFITGVALPVDGGYLAG